MTLTSVCVCRGGQYLSNCRSLLYLSIIKIWSHHSLAGRGPMGVTDAAATHVYSSCSSSIYGYTSRTSNNAHEDILHGWFRVLHETLWICGSCVGMARRRVGSMPPSSYPFDFTQLLKDSSGSILKAKAALCGKSYGKTFVWLTRWYLALQPFKFKVAHRLGVQLPVADFFPTKAGGSQTGFQLESGGRAM